MKSFYNQTLTIHISWFLESTLPLITSSNEEGCFVLLTLLPISVSMPGTHVPNRRAFIIEISCNGIFGKIANDAREVLVQRNKKIQHHGVHL